LLLYRD